MRQYFLSIGRGSVHRSQYEAAQTAQYENARHLVKTLINAEDEKP